MFPFQAIPRRNYLVVAANTLLSHVELLWTLVHVKHFSNGMNYSYFQRGLEGPSLFLLSCVTCTYLSTLGFLCTRLFHFNMF